jgi:hypothetical protein
MWVSSQIVHTPLSHLHPPIQIWACNLSLQALMEIMEVVSINLTLPLANLWCKPILTPTTMIILSIAKTTRQLKVHTGGSGRGVRSSRTWYTFPRVPRCIWGINWFITQVGHRLCMRMGRVTRRRLGRDRAKPGDEKGVARGSLSRKITNNRARPLRTSIIIKAKTQGPSVYRRKWMWNPPQQYS